MVTDTMLFLSIRQRNWDAAVELAVALQEEEATQRQEAIYRAVVHAAAGDGVAQFLLTILVETEWNS
ncbi:hypothetical protein KAH37_04960 [bacterium]|nr:hypothetical protein [bacterium]